jgi:hypothetical protein
MGGGNRGNLSIVSIFLVLIAVSAYLSFSGNTILATSSQSPCKLAGEQWNYESNNNLPPFDCCPGFRASPDGYCYETGSQELHMTTQVPETMPPAIDAAPVQPEPQPAEDRPTVIQETANDALQDIFSSMQAATEPVAETPIQVNGPGTGQDNPDPAITCYSSGGCGSDGWVGDPYCRSGNVYQKWRTYACENPGTPLSYCSHSDKAKKKQGCSNGCTDGKCLNLIAQPASGMCNQDSDCETSGWLGQEYCSSGGGENTDVYDVYRTHKCINPGTPSSYCTYTDEHKKKEDCGDTTYGAWSSEYCYDNDVYKERTADQKGCIGDESGVHCYSAFYIDREKVTECGSYTCTDGKCDFTCYQASDCGTNGYVGSPYCSGGDVYQDYRTYACENPGTIDSDCKHTDAVKKKEDCGTAGCTDGHCNIGCEKDSDCGANGYVGSPYCKDGDVYQSWKTYTCNNPGTKDSYCSDLDTGKKKQDCGNKECSNGGCVGGGSGPTPATEKAALNAMKNVAKTEMRKLGFKNNQYTLAEYYEYGKKKKTTFDLAILVDADRNGKVEMRIGMIYNTNGEDPQKWKKDRKKMKGIQIDESTTDPVTTAGYIKDVLREWFGEQSPVLLGLISSPAQILALESAPDED